MTALKKLKRTDLEFGDLIEYTPPLDAIQKWEKIDEIFKRNKKKFITKINEWRTKNNVGVSRFCKMFGISVRQYYRLMSEDDNITLKTMAELAQTLDFDFEFSIK